MFIKLRQIKFTRCKILPNNTYTMYNYFITRKYKTASAMDIHLKFSFYRWQITMGFPPAVAERSQSTLHKLHRLEEP